MENIENMQNQQNLMRKISEITVYSYYTHQDLRKDVMNKIRDFVYRINEGIAWDEVQEKKETKTYAKKYEDKNLLNLVEKMFKENKIQKETKDCLINAIEQFKKSRELEAASKNNMKKFVKSEPIWNKYLIHIPGIGPVIATNLISNFRNCENFKSISSLWRYCGLHPVCPTCTEKRKTKDNKIREYPVLANSKGKCPICGKNGVGEKRITGQSIDYNPKMRTLMFKIGDCLIKKDSPIYRSIYDEHKQRQLERTYAPGELLRLYPVRSKNKNTNNESEEKKPVYKYEDTHISLGHAHARAIRKMMKVFLQNYWVYTRTLAKLEVSQPYVQAHMNHSGIFTWQEVLKANNIDPNTALSA
ncbi:MAG: transposase [Candidatus Nanoarchaeia archaeon]